MPTAPITHSPLDDMLTGPLDAAAQALTANDAGEGEAPLVVVVRPGTADQRVIGAGGNNALRAAVSVAAAAENSRLWGDIPLGDTLERSVHTLPEVVRAAAEGAGISHVHVGTVNRTTGVACAALWFATPTAGPDLGTRRSVLALLDAAVDKDDVARAAAASRISHRSEERRSPAPTQLQVGSDDPAFDRTTGLASRERFDEVVADFDGDEASMVLIDLDEFGRLDDAYGREVSDAVLREVAARLVQNCRGTDLVARIGADEFAILTVDADRATALQIAKRLLATISEPLPADLGPERVTATVAMAHQIGMVDMDELCESAEDAVASGKRAGRARLVIAS